VVTGQAHRLAAVFPGDEFYVPPVETILEELTRPQHGHFNRLHHESAFRADLYLRGEDPLQRWGLARRPPRGTRSPGAMGREYQPSNG
jgi:hypothetical protein